MIGDNFIEGVDELYRRKLDAIGVSGKGVYTAYWPIEVNQGSYNSPNYTIKKSKTTDFIYTKNEVKVYFTDAEILDMLIRSNNKSAVTRVVIELMEFYTDKNTIEVEIKVNGSLSYIMSGIEIIEADPVMSIKDVTISFEDIITLLNLIMAKEYSVYLVNGNGKYKATIAKYVSILSWYVLEDDKAGEYLKSIGYSIDKNVIDNYSGRNSYIDLESAFNNSVKKFESFLIANGVQ